MIAEVIAVSDDATTASKKARLLLTPRDLNVEKTAAARASRLEQQHLDEVPNPGGHSYLGIETIPD